MSQSKPLIQLDGEHLSIEQILQFVSDPLVKIRIPEQCLRNLERSRQVLDEESQSQLVYGVNTGFGPMADRAIADDDLHALQKNLVRSHASGAGRHLPDEYVLAAMIVRLNTIIRGYSGISRELALYLVSIINHRIVPVVPEHGAVGTSGDLVQLAHIALILIGEGKARYQGVLQPTDEIFRTLQITPYVLQPKEGLALINGTAMMTGIAAILAGKARTLFASTLTLGGMSLDAIGGYRDPLDELLHKLRHHPGQQYVASELRAHLTDSNTIKDRIEHARPEGTQSVSNLVGLVQNVYSFRCMPQILGPIHETLESCTATIERELNAVTDNPVIDAEHQRFIHGGNFHGEYIAVAMDHLKLSLAKLSLLSERRINYFLDEKINGKYPPFLNIHTPGLTLALQGMQFTATSTAAQNQTLAFPHSVHSISTNASNQDVVSMGTDASLFTAQVLENTEIVLAIELIVILQAIDTSGQLHNLSTASKSAYALCRESIHVVMEDRPLYEDISRAVQLLRNKHFSFPLSQKVP